MKKIFSNLLLAYFVIGFWFTIPMSISYIYAEWFVLIDLGWSIFSLSGIKTMFLIGFLIFINPLIRGIFWLPSLIMWFNSPESYSFWMWLAPGFYISAGTG